MQSHIFGRIREETKKNVHPNGNDLKPEFRRGDLSGNPCRQLTSIFIMIWSQTHTHKQTHIHTQEDVPDDLAEGGDIFEDSSATGLDDSNDDL